MKPRGWHRQKLTLYRRHRRVHAVSGMTLRAFV